MIGSVKRFSDYHGYGFIKGQDSVDYFCHYSEIIADGFKSLNAGDSVEFEVIQSERGLQAKNIRLIKTLIRTEKFILKKNPFTPQDPVTDPKKFSGREEQFHGALDALYNSKNLLITGPRGVGKSSLAYQMLYITQGETALLEKHGISLEGFEFKSMTGDYRCVQGNGLQTIINGLLSSLFGYVGKEYHMVESKYSFEADLKLAKYSSEETAKSFDITEMVSYFVIETERLFREYDHKYTSITFLIDEMDTLDVSVDLASFLKAIVEKFRLDGFKNVSFICCGVTGTITKLMQAHPSASRLFESLDMVPMQPSELKEILLDCLEGTGTSITMEAVDGIVSLSNRFPQPVHLLGYHSFRVDKDESIGSEDVDSAKDYIVQNIKSQEFDGKLKQFNESIHFKILSVMASYPKNSFTVDNVTTSLSQYSERHVTGSMGLLVEKEIIKRVHAKGEYEFTDPLFRTYIKWIFIDSL